MHPRPPLNSAKNRSVQQKKWFDLMDLGEPYPRSGHISQRKKKQRHGKRPQSQHQMGILVRKLSLWIVLVALGLAVKMLLGLSRFFDRLSQRLYKGIVPVINTLNKGDRP